MKLIRVIPAWAWLVVSYVLLGAALCWSANQPMNNMSGTVFFLAILTSWLPAYIYANRRDMALNKVFWISQSAGLIAAVLVAVFVVPMLTQWMDAAVAQTREKNWLAFLGAFGTYWLASSLGGSMIASAFQKTEVAIEKEMSSTESKPTSKAP